MHLRTLQKTLALGLLVVIGLIHLVSAPDQFNDATYKGVLFLLNVGGALLAVTALPVRSAVADQRRRVVSQ